MRTKLPGPRTPMSQAAWGIRLMRNPYDAFVDLHERYGPVCAVGYRPFRYVYLFGRDANEAVLSTHRDVLEWREALKALIPVDGETALVVSDGEEHARRRRLVQPAFSLRRVHRYMPIIADEARTAADALVSMAQVDVHVVLKRAIRRVAIRTLFGDALGTKEDVIGDALQIAIDYANLPPFLHSEREIPFTPYRRAMRSVRVIDGMVFAEIDRRRREGTERSDLLDALIASRDSGDGLTDKELRDQVVSLIAGGYETTAAHATWTMFALLSHPDVLALTTEEIDRLDDDFGADELEACGYLHAVVSESLRLYPPGPFSGRFVREPIEVLGREIPAGQIIVYSAFVTHRLPELWPNPLTFDPSRWLEGDRPDPFAYVPFGGGYRRCIGFALASFETKVIIAHLLRNTVLTLRSLNVQPTGYATMQPRDGVVVSARLR